MLPTQRTFINPIVRDEVTFVNYSSETGGEFTEIDCLLMPGGGNPPHYHNAYAEIFTAVEGALGLQVGKRTMLLQPGQSATVDIGTVHRFFNSGNDPVRFHALVKPGHHGFENTLRIVYGLARDGECRKDGTPRSLIHLAVLMMMSDTRIPGPMKLLTPLLRFLAKRARRKGIEAELIRRYCSE